MTKQQQTDKTKALRKKKCKHCKNWFTPEKPMQTTCSFTCAIAYSSNPKVKTKEINKRKKEAKQNDKSYWTKKAQDEFNKFIRLRDKDLPCVSCDYDWKSNGTKRQAHASHFQSVGKAKNLRFNEYNVHKSCSICNSHLSGNLSEYEQRLIIKIGKEKVEELKKLAHTSKPNKYTLEDLKNIYMAYKEKNKRLIN